MLQLHIHLCCFNNLLIYLLIRKVPSYTDILTPQVWGSLLVIPALSAHQQGAGSSWHRREDALSDFGWISWYQRDNFWKCHSCLDCHSNISFHSHKISCFFSTSSRLIPGLERHLVIWFNMTGGWFMQLCHFNFLSVLSVLGKTPCQAVSDITFIYAVYTPSLIVSSVAIEAILPRLFRFPPRQDKKRLVLDWTLWLYLFGQIFYSEMKGRICAPW